MKVAAILGGALIAGMCLAQDPNVAFRVDLNLNYTSTKGSQNRVRWFDPRGKMSTVGFGINLEPGYYVLVTQRLQTVRGNPDREVLEDLYIEDPGLWRVGRQKMVFGGDSLVQESIQGVRVEADPAGRRFPMVIAAFDNGPRNARGIAGRAGTDRLGISAAYGERLFRSSTNFAALRTLEVAMPGQGYRAAIALDGAIPWGIARVEGEVAAFRRGKAGAPPLDLSDLRVVFIRTVNRQMVAGWARDWRSRRDFYRLETEVPLSKNLSLLGYVRFQGGEWRDLSIGTRVRL